MAIQSQPTQRYQAHHDREPAGPRALRGQGKHIGHTVLAGGLTLPILAIWTVASVIVAPFPIIVTTFSVVLEVALPVVRASGALTVAVTPIIVTVAAVQIAVAAVIVPFIAVVIPLIPVILTRRYLTSTTWRRRTATARRRAIATAVAARIKAPGRGRRGASPLRTGH